MTLRSERRKEARSALNLVIEVVLIALGVFLALWANNWNERREHRAQAQAALRNFIGEMETNREQTQEVRAYHEKLAKELSGFLNGGGPLDQAHFDSQVHFLGVRPVIFEHTAWDLALATQALAYLPPKLAFDLSKVYTKQGAFQAVENGFLSSTFTPTSLNGGALVGLSNSIMVYLGDVNTQEPELLKLYDKVLPEAKGDQDR